MRQDPSKILTDVVEKLSMAHTLPAITQTVATAARALSGADGATFVLRDEDKCFYADENAISPLWKGKRFPLEACISGWSMLNKEVVVIDDIYKDRRIPHDAYRPTFVKSLCMVPIRAEDPMGAIGNYWAQGYQPSEEEIKVLQVLANSTAIALENLQLKQSILKQSHSQLSMEDRQREFETAIHTMAHDLRNPLTTMMLFTELLQSKLAGQIDPRLAGYFKSILKTGERANDQIRKMLEMYSVGHRQLEREPVDLSAMVSEVSEQMKPQMASHKVDVEVEPNLTVLADPPLIRVAIENLVSNAFKYTGKKDPAHIEFGKFAEAGDAATFFIRDNGAGFDPIQAQNLFRPLVRLHSDSDFPGTGLGLASVARIIELHGGKIRAEGKKDEGASFYFSLPLQA